MGSKRTATSSLQDSSYEAKKQNIGVMNGNMMDQSKLNSNFPDMFNQFMMNAMQQNLL